MRRQLTIAWAIASYANRPRGMRRQVDPIGPVAPLPIVVAPRLAPTEATRRWASLL
jgi:hypothetical protein